MKLILSVLFFFCLVSCTAAPPDELKTQSEPSMYKSSDGVDFGSAAREAPKGWSVDGVLATPDAAGVTPSLSVGLQQLFPAGTYTLQFGLTRPADIGGSVKIARAVATVEWSVAGNTITRVITVDDGTSLTGVAEGVRVTVVDATRQTLGSPGYNYNVSISLAAGQRASYEVVPLLLPSITAQSVQTGTPVTIPIPRGGVKLVAILPGNFTIAGVNSDLTYKDLTVYQYDVALNTLAVWKPGFSSDLWIPVVPGADRLFIVSNTVGGLVGVTVLFGIDG